MAWARQYIGTTDVSTGSTTFTHNIPSPGDTPAANELIVVCGGVEATNTLISIQDQNGDNFTNVDNYYAALSAGGEMAYKLADGDETSVTITRGMARVGEIGVAIYSGLDTTSPFDASAENTADAASNGTTHTTTGVTPSSQPGVMVYMMAVDQTRRWDSGDFVAVTNGAVINDLTRSANRAGLVIAEDGFTSTSSQSTQFSTGSGGSWRYSIAAAFLEPGGGPIAGQPFMKRLAGVPGMSTHSGVW